MKRSMYKHSELKEEKIGGVSYYQFEVEYQGHPEFQIFKVLTRKSIVGNSEIALARFKFVLVSISYEVRSKTTKEVWAENKPWKEGRKIKNYLLNI